MRLDKKFCFYDRLSERRVSKYPDKFIYMYAASDGSLQADASSFFELEPSGSYQVGSTISLLRSLSTAPL